jgi:hypothetical protein
MFRRDIECKEWVIEVGRFDRLSREDGWELRGWDLLTIEQQPMW